MKKANALHTLTAAAAALLVASCASTSLGSAHNAPLAWAPAETAFAFGNLERLPQSVQALNTRWMEQMRPGLIQSLTRLQEVLINSADESKATGKQTGTQTGSLLKLLQEELDKPGGFANLGLDVNGRGALYEVHALPVLRLELADKARFEAFMQKAENQQAQGEKIFASSQLQGQRYWHTVQPAVEGDDSAGQSFAPRGILAIVGNHLVLTVDMQRQDTPLAALLGLQRPSQSVVGTRAITAINKQYGYLNSGLGGFVDTQRLLTRLIGDGQADTWISQTLADDGLEIGAACRNELQSLAAKAPRLVLGATTLNDKQMVIHGLLEMPADLTKDLSALPAPVPSLGTVSGPFVMGGGIHISAAATFLQKQLAAVQATPYQCEYLGFVNEMAKESTALLGALHAASSWVQGVRMEFSKLDMTAENFSGILLLASPNPSGLISMAQSLFPEAAKLALKPDGVARQLKDSPTDETLWLAMGDKTIAAALGEANRDKMPSLLSAPALPKPPLLYMEATGQAYADMFSSMREDKLLDTASSELEALYHYVTWPLTAGSIDLYKEVDNIQTQWLLTDRGMELTQDLRLKVDAKK